MTFTDGGTLLGSGVLDSAGRATFSVSTLTIGEHAITAAYQGDTNFATSASASLTQTVNERVPVPIDARLVVVASASAQDASAALPISVPSVHVNSTFYVEVWARDGDGSTRGITGGDLSFSFDNTKVTGGTINHGGIFTNLTSGTLHNTAGTVTDLGGDVAPGDNGEGVSQWVRLGYVSFTASAAGTSNFTASRGSDHFARAFEGGIARAQSVWAARRSRSARE